jgi:hypothetical protein
VIYLLITTYLDKKDIRLCDILTEQ